jgi:hypothetical protein
MKKKRNKEPQLIFHGCIVDLDSPKPHKLTREQTKQLAEIIYIMFKKWYATGLLDDQIDRKVLSEKRTISPRPRLPGSKRRKTER